MELYDSEEQQVEAIKDWWKENGKAVVLGLVIGLGGLFGWRTYQDSVTSGQEAASDAYTQTMEVLSAQGVAAADQVQSFIDANSEREYAVLAALQLAQSQVGVAEYDKALAQLEWAKNHSTDTTLAPVISLRIVRVKAEMGDVDAAMADLDAMSVEGWEGRISELRGDLLMRKGNNAAAYTAYSQAQQASDASQTLQIKLDDLAK